MAHGLLLHVAGHAQTIVCEHVRVRTLYKPASAQPSVTSRCDTVANVVTDQPPAYC